MGRSIYGSVRFSPFSARREICAECGKEFSCPDSTRYTRVIDHKRVVYCSHTCYRVIGKLEEEAEKDKLRKQEEYLRQMKERQARALQRYKEKKIAEQTLGDARARVRECENKVAEYTALVARLPPGTPRNRARQRLKSWLRKRKTAIEILEDKERAREGA